MPIFLLSALAGCIEPFDTEEAGINGLLVVDGHISDQPGPYRVSLSRSASLTDTTFEKVRSAQVFIEEENGIREQLTEGGAGAYFSSAAGIRGQVGKEYRLTIELPSGASYASDWVTLKLSPPIDSVFYIFEERAISGDFETGFQVYVNSEDPTGNVRHYRYEWVETWKYFAPFPAFFNYIGGEDGTETEPSGGSRFCWRSDTSNLVNVASSLNNNTTRVSQHPTAFASTMSNQLALRYSVLVRQFALDQQEFEFWQGLEETNSDNGSIFDKQPQVVEGNVINVGNPSEPVLGYFGASTVSEKRIYIDRQDLPDGVSPDRSLLVDCISELDSVPRDENFQANVFLQINLGKVFFDFYGDFGIAGAVLTTPECSDCTLQGGVITPPDFWIETDD